MFIWKFLRSVLYFNLFSLANTAVFLMLPAWLFKHNSWFFRTRKWEQGGAIYQKLFGVRFWKNTLPELGDFSKTVFPKKKIVSLDRPYLEQYLSEACRAELCHWSIICTMPFFAYASEQVYPLIMSISGFVLNIPYVIIQRYNLPRVRNLLPKVELEENHD